MDVVMDVLVVEEDEEGECGQWWEAGGKQDRVETDPNSKATTELKGPMGRRFKVAVEWVCLSAAHPMQIRKSLT